MHYYKTKYGYPEDDFPVASRISNNSIALPVGPHVEIEDIEYMTTAIKEALTEAQS